jgi:hypothetical protein
VGRTADRCAHIDALPRCAALRQQQSTAPLGPHIGETSPMKSGPPSKWLGFANRRSAGAAAARLGGMRERASTHRYTLNARHDDETTTPPPGGISKR